MNTITVDSNIYKEAEAYAKQHDISIEAVFEKALSLLLGKIRPKQKTIDDAELKHAMEVMETMMIKGGTPVPAAEDGKGALPRIKYGALESL